MRAISTAMELGFADNILAWVTACCDGIRKPLFVRPLVNYGKVRQERMAF